LSTGRALAISHSGTSRAMVFARGLALLKRSPTPPAPDIIFRLVDQ
jgi:hypothetical protein